MKNKIFLILMLAFMSFYSYASDFIPKRVAFLVGNWDYDLSGSFWPTPLKEGYLPDLKSPCNDVEKVKEALKLKGFTVHSYCNLKKDDFEKKLSEFSGVNASLPKGSLIFVYYAGHGIQQFGRAFALPVLFEFLQDDVDHKKVSYLKRSSIEISRIFKKLSADYDVGVIVAIDACRDGLFDLNDGYNSYIEIGIPPNFLVLYATTPGSTTPDPNKNSLFSTVLSSEIENGKDAGDAISRVVSTMFRKYREGSVSTYPTSNVGAAFSAMNYLPLKVDVFASKPTVISSADGSRVRGNNRAFRKKVIVRKEYDGITFDVFVCEGDGEQERFRFASNMTNALSLKAKEYGIGRIMIKPLAEGKNAENGYRVHRNIMRYDPKVDKEEKLLRSISIDFPSGHFLPKSGIGVNGRPTENYVSAFICGRVAE